MKKLIIVLAIFIISWVGLGAFFIYEEYSHFEYQVQVEKCQGVTDTLQFITSGGTETIQTYREALPVLVIGKKRFINVCDYKILSKKKIN